MIAKASYTAITMDIFLSLLVFLVPVGYINGELFFRRGKFCVAFPSELVLFSANENYKRAIEISIRKNMTKTT